MYLIHYKSNQVTLQRITLNHIKNLSELLQTKITNFALLILKLQFIGFYINFQLQFYI